MRPKRHTKNTKDTQWNTLNKKVINELNYDKKLMPVACAAFTANIKERKKIVKLS